MDTICSFARTLAARRGQQLYHGGIHSPVTRPRSGGIGFPIDYRQARSSLVQPRKLSKFLGSKNATAAAGSSAAKNKEQRIPV